MPQWNETEMICGTCFYGMSSGTIGECSCRIKAPVVIPTKGGLVTVFPPIKADEGCGQWKDRDTSMLEVKKMHAQLQEEKKRLRAEGLLPEEGEGAGSTKPKGRIITG